MAAVHYRNPLPTDPRPRAPPGLCSRPHARKFGERTPRVVRNPNGLRGDFFYNGIGLTKIGEVEQEFARHFPDLGNAAFDPVARVAFQKKANIAAEVLNPTQMSNIMPGKDV